jgi:hypothetical protein
MEKVVGEILLNDITLVTTANNKVFDPVSRIHFEDMPEDRLASDFDHRLGPEVTFLGNTRAGSTG